MAWPWTYSSPALLRRSVQINGVTGMCLTKLDVLDGLETLKLCTGYTIDGVAVDIFQSGAAAPFGADQRRDGHVPDQAGRPGRPGNAEAVHRLHHRWRGRGHIPVRRCCAVRCRSTA